MAEPLKIQRRIDEPALDQRALFRTGIKHVKRLSALVWTDHNVHDPGITILELLCFAITDLSYRASLPVEDLLVRAGDSGPLADQFLTARQILPCRPLTTQDFRKLLIDLDGVKNAWISPAEQLYFADLVHNELMCTDSGDEGVVPVSLAGLYGVLIDLDEGLTTTERNAILGEVRAILHANRNLCEDFVSVGVVDTQDFNLCCEIELDAKADAALVEATVRFEVQRYFAPNVPRYSLAGMLERRDAAGVPYGVDGVFDGPALDNGFIDDLDLDRAELRTELRLSDVIRLIMNIDGVRAVDNILLTQTAATELPPDPWRLVVESGRKPRLAQATSRLVFTKRGLPVVRSESEVDDYLAQLEERERAAAEALDAEDWPAPAGRVRALEGYLSFQQHLPAAYGIGDAGLSLNASAARRAKAAQLKAYLLFFDQVMADFLAQLWNVRELLSTDPDQRRSYFHKVVDTIPGFEDLFDDPDIAGLLGEVLDDRGVDDERRQRFLDHLIARFAERFHDYAAVMRSAFGASSSSIIRAKCAFLNDYQPVAANRSLGWNTALSADSALWDTTNVTGLQRRLARLLGMARFDRRDLSSLQLDAASQVLPRGAKFRFRLFDGSSVLLVSRLLSYDTASDAAEALRRTLRLAEHPGSYHRWQASGGRYWFRIVAPDGERLARSPASYATPEALDEAIDGCIAFVASRYSEEGMYVVESVLLRPPCPADSAQFLPIRPDPDCDECATADPYSYRLQVLLPAYGARFGDASFRDFVERTIREEAPAHVLPRVCWLSREAMAEFEPTWRAWIRLRTGVDTSQPAVVLRDLVAQLRSARSVYPVVRLHDCDSTAPEAMFVLGRTTLGTLNP